jgi:hypothetical protein
VGPPNLGGFREVVATTGHVITSMEVIEARCPPGTRVISGSAFLDSPWALAHPVVKTSVPQPGGDGWRALAAWSGVAQAPWQLTLRIHCVVLGGGAP